MLIDVLFLSFGTHQYNYAAGSMARKLKTNVYLSNTPRLMLVTITDPQRAESQGAGNITQPTDIGEITRVTTRLSCVASGRIRGLQLP